MQQDADILLLQTFSTCFGRHAPIIRSINTVTAATGTGSYWLQVDHHSAILGMKLQFRP